MSDPIESRILVTGANGNLGRRVVEHLLEAGAKNLIAASRDPAKLADFAGRGATTVKADFDDSDSLDAAFAGVERLLIISTDAVMVPGQRKRQHLAAVDAAIKAGVQHIVYTSMPNPEPGSLIPFAPDHYATEQAIEQSGIPFTILRVNWYSESLFMWLPQAAQSGQKFSSAGEGRVAHVAREDVARAAAAAVLSGAALGRINVAGPAALTTGEIVSIANDVLGTAISVVPVSDEQLAAGLNQAGLPAPLVELVVALDANTRVGGVDISSDAVERLTGTAPQTVQAFLAENRNAIGLEG